MATDEHLGHLDPLTAEEPTGEDGHLFSWVGSIVMSVQGLIRQSDDF